VTSIHIPPSIAVPAVCVVVLVVFWFACLPARVACLRALAWLCALLPAVGGLWASRVGRDDDGGVE